MTIHDIYGKSRINDIHAMFKEDMSHAKSKDDAIRVALDYMPYLWLDRAVNTTVNKYTEMQNLCDEMGKKGQWVRHIFDYPEKLIFARNQTNTESVIERMQNKEEVDYELYKATYDEVKRILKDDDFEVARNQTREDVRAYYLSVLVAMSTGRRITEILKTFSMSKKGTRLEFHGLLKKRGLPETKIGFLIFDDYKTVNKYLKELRAILDTTNLTNKEVGQKYNGKFNNFLDTKVFPSIKTSFKELRAIYVNIAWDEYQKSGGDMDKDLFFKNALGHEVVLSASDNYKTKEVK